MNYSLGVPRPSLGLPREIGHFLLRRSSSSRHFGRHSTQESEQPRESAGLEEQLQYTLLPLARGHVFNRSIEADVELPDEESVVAH